MRIGIIFRIKGKSHALPECVSGGFTATNALFDVTRLVLRHLIFKYKSVDVKTSDALAVNHPKQINKKSQTK